MLGPIVNRSGPASQPLNVMNNPTPIICRRRSIRRRFWRPARMKPSTPTSRRNDHSVNWLGLRALQRRQSIPRHAAEFRRQSVGNED